MTTIAKTAREWLAEARKGLDTVRGVWPSDVLKHLVPAIDALITEAEERDRRVAALVGHEGRSEWSLAGTANRLATLEERDRAVGERLARLEERAVVRSTQRHSDDALGTPMADIAAARLLASWEAAHAPAPPPSACREDCVGTCELADDWHKPMLDVDEPHAQTRACEGWTCSGAGPAHRSAPSVVASPTARMREAEQAGEVTLGPSMRPDLDTVLTPVTYAPGKSLRNLRAGLGLSLREVADSLGWTHVRLGEIERGDAPTEVEASALCLRLAAPPAPAFAPLTEEEREAMANLRGTYYGEIVTRLAVRALAALGVPLDGGEGR